jgi:hypothetical protein
MDSYIHGVGVIGWRTNFDVVLLSGIEELVVMIEELMGSLVLPAGAIVWRNP